ncbi:F-box/WD repeat-containing protein 9 [Papilio machaon]|uniref:F-box/WD repeat-containing protein 9 n=1 Tax=Papilio machaon TaxID=76193 RepID=UPI001E665970|nr:F-box/WD repeat-containing protein 9 [Papilio machaon]
MCEVAQTSKYLPATNSNISNDEEVYEAAEPTLLNMPVEIILKICSFLEADVLKYTLSKVCRRFEDILADDHLWKYWVHSKIKGFFPVLPNLKIWEETQIDWEEVCVEMDVGRKKWSNVKDTMKHIVVKDVHYASVDTVLLANKGEICLSGGRDRGMAFWHVKDLKVSDIDDDTIIMRNAKPKHIKHNAHLGWVWDLAADNIENASVVYSASWDNTVKAWDLASGLNCIETFRCGMSALSVVTADNIVMVGLYSKKILTFDIRSGSNPINAYKPHKGPVLALSSYKNMIASVSEDKTLAVWDRVAGKLIKNDIKIPADRAYPVCINWNSPALYIGDSKGSLHLFNPEDHTFVRTHEIWAESSVMEPSNKIVGCYQSQGNIIVCSDRGEIKFLYNCHPPQEYSSVQTSTIDVTQLQYLEGVLVIGTCDSALEFWISNERYDNAL